MLHLAPENMHNIINHGAYDNKLTAAIDLQIYIYYKYIVMC